MKINLSEILTKAWQITWKFKVLWIFGILAGCAGGSNRFSYSGGSSNGSGSGGNGSSEQLPEAFRQFENMRPMDAVSQFTGQYMGIIVAVILLLCVLWLLFFFLGVMGKTGLIKGTNKADTGTENLHFGELWGESTPYFWRIFGLRLLIGLPIFLVVVILLVGMGFAGFSAYSGGASGGGLSAIIIGMLGIFVAVMCVVGIASIVISMIQEQAENAIVLEDLGVLPGLSRGWQVLKSNLLSIIVISLILVVMGGVIGFLMALPLLAILLPVGLTVAATGAKSIVLPLIIGGGCLLVYLPVLFLLSGILQTYTQAALTLTYRRITAPVLPVEPPILDAAL